MGFFKRVIEKKDIEDHKKDREISEDISSVDLERLYLKLYMKISRDFVMKKDYERVIEELKYSAGIEEDGDVLGLYSNEEALSLGYDYKDILDEDRVEEMNYEDLIDLSE